MWQNAAQNGQGSPMGNAFFDATDVNRQSEAHYTGKIDERWNLRPLPQGGIVTAIAARAMADRLDHPDQRLRVLHTTFAAQVAHGPVDIDVELLRQGRSMSHLRAEVRNVGAARGHLTTGIFGAPRRGYDFTDLEPPARVRPPAECPSFRDPPPPDFSAFPPMPFWTELVEGRVAIGHAPWEDHEPGRAERAVWYRFDDAPFLDDGTIDPLSLAVLVDSMPGAVGDKVGPGTWFAPSIDLTVHLLDDCRSPWVMAHNRARYVGDGYASADMALWDYGPHCDQLPRLVAYATQMFLFSFAD
jgi:acyl-CoA thioesterase